MRPDARGEVIRSGIELGQAFPVSYRPEQDVVLLRCPFPDGWSPAVGCLRIDPPEEYSECRPTVSLPPAYQYRGRSWTETRLRPPLAPVEEPYMRLNFKGKTEWSASQNLLMVVSDVFALLKSPDTAHYVRESDDTSAGIGWGPGAASQLELK